MAKRKSEAGIRITQKEYMELVEASMILKALKIAGIEKMPIYQSIKYILKDDGRVEIHEKPIPKRYR